MANDKSAKARFPWKTLNGFLISLKTLTLNTIRMFPTIDITTNGTYRTRRKITTASIPILLVFGVACNEIIISAFKQTDAVLLCVYESCTNSFHFFCKFANCPNCPLNNTRNFNKERI